MIQRLGIVTFAAACATSVSAQEPAPLKVTPLRGGVFVVEGGRTPGGTVNTGFVVGDRGVIAIDSEASPAVAGA